MIISHAQELIFIKPKKVAGTSFEIALSKFCGDDCIITPIAPRDEKLRQELGFKTAQNYDGVVFPGREPVLFQRHDRASYVRANVPKEMWNDYQTISLIRNPYDVAISRFFWAGGPAKTGLEFDEYLEKHTFKFSQNAAIAPFEGPDRVQTFLRYEHIEEDSKAAGLSHIWDTFSGIMTKNKSRPREGASIEEMYAKHPRAAEIISEVCKSEIEYFGYELPA